MRLKKSRSGVMAGIVLPMGLVCLCAFCSLALALLGGRAYKQIQNAADDGFGSTVAASYLRTKLSQNNAGSAVTLREENGVAVLVIANEGPPAYETRIYMAGGELREDFVPAGTAFNPVGGMRVAALARCDFTLDGDGLFTAEIESLAGSVTRACFAVSKGGLV
jgi:hypothetical protein